MTCWQIEFVLCQDLFNSSEEIKILEINIETPVATINLYENLNFYEFELTRLSLVTVNFTS